MNPAACYMGGLIFWLLSLCYLFSLNSRSLSGSKDRPAVLLGSLFCQILSSLLLSNCLAWSALSALWTVLIILLVEILICALMYSALKNKLSLPEGMGRFLLALTKPFTFWIGQPVSEQDESSEEEEEPEVLERAQDIVPQENVVENAQDLNETDADAICTHRSQVVSLNLKDDPAKWRQIILGNRHTFYPLVDETGEDVVGVLDSRDYFRLNGYSKKRILDETVDKPMFVSENMSADELIHKMKQTGTYFAVVLDEYGGFTGIVSLHDIVEELFGDLRETEDPKRSAHITRLPKGVWRINGEADLEDVSRALGVPLELDDFETFSGYILGSLGKIPEDGTQLETTIGPLDIQIKKIAGHRIRQTLVKVKKAEDESPQQ